jgi:diacylglycerol kinase family enzyme
MVLHRIETERPSAVRRVIAVVNPKAGSVGEGAAEELMAILGERGVSGRVLAVSAPDELGADLQRAAEDGIDAAIILGGDGTARTAAELAGPDGVPLILLPGGTMNVLPHALYGPLNWQAALARALDEGHAQDLPGARAGDHLFFVAAMFGSPALAATAREAIREGKIVAAVDRARFAMRRAFGRRLRARADHAPLRRTEAAAVIAPLVAQGPGLDRMETAYLDPAGALSAFRLGVGALTGGWRKDPSVELAVCTSADIYGRGEVPAILDGEQAAMSAHVRIEVVPRAARVIAPPLTELNL